jgi:hypothetical protein
MTAAAAAILQRTDEILLKPVDANSLIDAIKQQLSNRPPHKSESSRLLRRFWSAKQPIRSEPGTLESKQNLG